MYDDHEISKGMRRLVCEILRKAIHDYRLLEKRGWVTAGVIKDSILEIKKDAKRRRVVCANMRVVEALELVDLFWSNELQILCRESGLNIEPEQIRKKLGLPEEQPLFEAKQLEILWT